MDRCMHESLQFACSPFAEVAGFERPDASKRHAATTKSGRQPARLTKLEQKDAAAEAATFPGPLVLPWDDLNHDPEWPPQSFRSWLNEKERNKPDESRKAIYVVGVPEIDEQVGYMADWTIPNLDAPSSQAKEPAKKKSKRDGTIKDKGKQEPPGIEEHVAYLSAFYHGLDIRASPFSFRFVPWSLSSTAKPKRAGPKTLKPTQGPHALPEYVGLAQGDHCTRIRVRACPDNVYPAQLNLNDILDHLLAHLPKDAYSIVLLVNHDIHEDENDDFCCGRAYGGSRIAVVQTARYDPILDAREDADLYHFWPASHCESYVNRLCAAEDVFPSPSSTSSNPSKSGAIRAAIDATLQMKSSSGLEDPKSLWFSRLARTVSHELGHCLGMDHCVYYACVMQGTASMSEDARQPPYLCPVCLMKVSYAVACELEGGGDGERKAYVRDRYQRLMEFCGKRNQSEMFAGYGAWLKARMVDIR